MRINVVFQRRLVFKGSTTLITHEPPFIWNDMRGVKLYPLMHIFQSYFSALLLKFSITFVTILMDFQWGFMSELHATRGTHKRKLFPFRLHCRPIDFCLQVNLAFACVNMGITRALEPVLKRHTKLRRVCVETICWLIIIEMWITTAKNNVM